MDDFGFIVVFYQEWWFFDGVVVDGDDQVGLGDGFVYIVIF